MKRTALATILAGTVLATQGAPLVAHANGPHPVARRAASAVSPDYGAGRGTCHSRMVGLIQDLQGHGLPNPMRHAEGGRGWPWRHVFPNPMHGTAGLIQVLQTHTRAAGGGGAHPKGSPNPVHQQGLIQVLQGYTMPASGGGAHPTVVPNPVHNTGK